MIKFLGDKDGKPLYGFGLSEGNMQKLLEGQPIFIDLDVMAMKAPPSTQRGAVLIFGGKNEDAMYAELANSGVISPSTEIKEQRDSIDQPRRTT